MLIVESKALENGARRNQTGRWSRIPDGYLLVPPDLEQEAVSYLPFMDLTTENGQIVSVAENVEARESWVPPAVPYVPTAEEQNRADIDYLAVMMGVEL